MSDEIVELLYRGILRRPGDPEGRAVYSDLLRKGRPVADILKMFIGCAEFRASKIVKGPAGLNTPSQFVPLSAPAMHVECRASPAQLSKLNQRIEQAWTTLGTEQPYHSVLTGQEYLPGNINEGSIARFWASGVREASEISAMLLRHGLADTTGATCVEYGCGLGRITFPLAKMFRNVEAYDISPPHLKMAQEEAVRLGRENVTFHRVTARTFRDGLSRCDFFYSQIVLQHNPPPVIGKLISMLLDALQPGGIGIFQVPTYSANYRFQIDEYLARASTAEMEMHFIPQDEVFELIADAGCRLLEVREDGWIGRVGHWISNTFIIKKRN